MFSAKKCERILPSGHACCTLNCTLRSGEHGKHGKHGTLIRHDVNRAILVSSCSSRHLGICLPASHNPEVAGILAGICGFLGRGTCVDFAGGTGLSGHAAVSQDACSQDRSDILPRLGGRSLGQTVVFAHRRLLQRTPNRACVGLCMPCGGNVLDMTRRSKKAEAHGIDSCQGSTHGAWNVGITSNAVIGFFPAVRCLVSSGQFRESRAVVDGFDCGLGLLPQLKQRAAILERAIAPV
jgi:hypothetical protein